MRRMRRKKKRYEWIVGEQGHQVITAGIVNNVAIVDTAQIVDQLAGAAVIHRIVGDLFLETQDNGFSAIDPVFAMGIIVMQTDSAGNVPNMTPYGPSTIESKWLWTKIWPFGTNVISGTSEITTQRWPSTNAVFSSSAGKPIAMWDHQSAPTIDIRVKRKILKGQELVLYFDATGVPNNVNAYTALRVLATPL